MMHHYFVIFHYLLYYYFAIDAAAFISLIIISLIYFRFHYFISCHADFHLISITPYHYFISY